MWINLLVRGLLGLSALGVLAPAPASAAPPSRPQRSETAAKPRPKQGPKHRPTPQELLARHTAERDADLDIAAGIEQAAGPRARADWLHARAHTQADPEAYLDAVEATLALQPMHAHLERAADDLAAAGSLLQPRAPLDWLDDAEAARLLARHTVLDARLQEARDALSVIAAKEQLERSRRLAAERQLRRGRQELIAGAVLMTGSLAGVGVALGGLAHERQYQAYLASPDLVARDPEAVEAHHTYGRTLVAAGAIGAVLFAATGIPLLASGGHDLKLGRRALARPAKLALQPGPASLTLRLAF